MTKQNKIDLVNNLSSSFLDTNIIVCNYKGLSVRQLEKLRINIKQSESKIKIIKNKLANIAFTNANIEGLSLKGTNIFIWGKDQISISKNVQQFSDSNKDKFIIKFGYFDGKFVDSSHIESLSKLPNKEELLGILLSVWNAPIRYFVTGIDNFRKEKEKNN